MEKSYIILEKIDCLIVRCCAILNLKKKENAMTDITPIRTRPIGKFALQKDVEIKPISKIDLTNQTVKALVAYCKLCNVENFEGVIVATDYALNNIITVKEGKGDKAVRYAFKCREFVDKFDFFVNKTAAELGIYPSVINSATLLKLKKEKKPNPIEFLYYTHLLMPNLDPNHFSKNMNSIRTAVNTFWDRLTGVRHSSMQSMLYLYSVEGGVGKSVFQNIIKEWAESRKVELSFSRAPHNQFVGDEFNKNAIVIFSDITRDECQNWARLNDLVDGTNYVVEKKGEDRYELKAQAFLIGSSNFHPKDDNNRRIANSLVYFGATKLEPLSNFPDVFVLKNGAVDIEHYIPIVDKWITSCPDNGFDFREYATGVESSAKDWFEGLSSNYYRFLRAIARYCMSDTNHLKSIEYEVSVITLHNRISSKIREGKIDEVANDETIYPSTYNNILYRLLQNKKIKLTKDSKDTYGKKYNIKSIVDNAEMIAEEHLEKEDGSLAKDMEDYEWQRKTVIDVANAILKKKPQPICEECQQFLKTEGKLKETPPESPKKTLPTEIERPMLNVGTIKKQNRHSEKKGSDNRAKKDNEKVKD